MSEKGGCKVGKKGSELGGCKEGKKKIKFVVRKKVIPATKAEIKFVVHKPERAKKKSQQPAQQAKVVPAKKRVAKVAKVIPATKAEINLPKFLGHTGSDYATGADHWWLKNEDKKKWKKMYNDLIEKDFKKQGLKKEKGEFEYTMKQFDIAGNYADKKMREYWHSTIEKK